MNNETIIDANINRALGNYADAYAVFHIEGMERTASGKLTKKASHAKSALNGRERVFVDLGIANTDFAFTMDMQDLLRGMIERHGGMPGMTSSSRSEWLAIFRAIVIDHFCFCNVFQGKCKHID